MALDSDPAKAGEPTGRPALRGAMGSPFYFFKPKSNSHGNLDGPGGAHPCVREEREVEGAHFDLMWKEQQSGQTPALRLSPSLRSFRSSSPPKIKRGQLRPSRRVWKQEGRGRGMEMSRESPRSLREVGGADGRTESGGARGAAPAGSEAGARRGAGSGAGAGLAAVRPRRGAGARAPAAGRAAAPPEPAPCLVRRLPALPRGRAPRGGVGRGEVAGAPEAPASACVY